MRRSEPDCRRPCRAPVVKGVKPGAIASKRGFREQIRDVVLKISHVDVRLITDGSQEGWVEEER